MKKVVVFLVLVLTGIAFGETYTLSAPGNVSNSTTSFDSSNGWSPAATSAPCEGNGYVVEGASESALSTIRMQESNPRVFGGDSLTLKYGQLNLRVASVTVPNLIVDTFGRICNQLSPSSFTLAGACSIPVDSVFEIWTLKDRDIIVDSSITGAGEVHCTVGDNVAYVNMQGPTFGPNALSGFAGSLVIASTATVGRNLQIKFQSLPGEPEESKGDAILVDGDATLRFECTGVIGPKRGITFTANSKPTIFVKDGCVIKINSAVIAQRGFTKTGNGTVIMSGDVSQVAQNEIEILQGNVVFGDVDVDSLRATLNGYVGEVDGRKHAPSVTIQEPVDGLGCTIEWKKISDLHWSATAPTFSEAGTYAVQCHIQCEGYADFYGIALIQLGADDAVSFVSLSGRHKAPYDTPENAAIDLQSAIEAVKGVETLGRRYVFVDVGSYGLPKRMTVEGLSLVGSGPSLTAIRGCGVDLKGSELRGMSFDSVSDAVTTEGECVIDDCEFRNAQWSRYVIFAGGHAVVTNTKIIDNTLNSADTVGGGTAPFLLRTIGSIVPSLEVADCVVCGNSAGGRSLSAGVVGVDATVDNQSVSFDRCVFMHNTGRCGIARMTSRVDIDYHSSLTMRNCLCVDCKSVDQPIVGTGTSVLSASVLLFVINGKVVNCTFDDCWADGTIFYVGNNTYAGEFSAKNNIFRNCKNKTGEAALGVSALDLVAQVDHSVVYPKAAVENIAPETNTFDTDVTFEGPGKSKPEYALAKGSHGLRFGDASIWRDVFQPKDLAGKARVIKGKVDVGCYQFQPMAGLVILLGCIK